MTSNVDSHALAARDAGEPPFWTHRIHSIEWCQALQRAFPAILAELQDLIVGRSPFKNFPDYGLYSNGWEAFPVSLYDGEFNDFVPGLGHLDMAVLARHARQHLPVLSALVAPLESANHLRNGFVSRLRPGSVIKPHRGWTPEYLRIHMGLVCDPGCRLTVGPETQVWEAGKLLAFKDGGPYMHSVRHEGTHERIVVSFDLRLSYVEQFIPEIQSAPRNG